VNSVLKSLLLLLLSLLLLLLLLLFGSTLETVGEILYYEY